LAAKLEADDEISNFQDGYTNNKLEELLATSLWSVLFSIKEEIHHGSLAYTPASSSFNEKGTAF
jgi:hypothetical protein